MSAELLILSLAAKAACSHAGLPEFVNPVIDGITGNRADALVQNLAAQMRSADGIPANHHVQRAGQTALRETLRLLVSAVAAEVGDKPPLWEALRRHLREGSLGERPLIQFRDFPEFEWLERLQALAGDERAVADLQRRLPFDETRVMAALRSDAAAEQAGRAFDETLAAWLAEHLADIPARPACLDDFLRNGFPLEPGGPTRIRPFQAWRLIFAEAAKTTPEVFNILVLRALADLTGRRAAALPDWSAFQHALAEPVAFIRADLRRIEDKIDGLQRNLSGLDRKVDALPQAIQDAIDRSIRSYRPGALHQLKSPPEHFTGRAAQLAELVAALTGGTRANPVAAVQPVVISAVNGMGGVGKTALALMAAYAVRADFPDMQLLIELGTHSPSPVSAEQARDRVLIAAYPQSPLPADDGARWQIYRELFHDRRALVLLDDAADDRQVDKLKPPPGCALLVTSRQRLRGGQPVHLDRLPPEDAAELLRKLAPHLRDSEAAALASLCGELPVALRIAGGYLKTHPTPAAEYIQALQANRLRRLREKGTEDDVSLVFGYSYAKLSPAEQQAWTALAIMVASFDREAGKPLIAAGLRPRWWQRLTRREPLDPGDMLDSFVHLNLLDYDPEAQRFGWHDLLREFAAAKLDGERGKMARATHARHYAEVAQQSQALYVQGHDGVRQGLALFDRERPQLEAAFAHLLTRPELAKTLLNLVGGVAYVGDLRFHPRQHIQWLEAQAQAARHIGHRKAEAVALGNMGAAYFKLGEPRKAIECSEQQLSIARDIGDQSSECKALGNLGLVYVAFGEVHKAIENLDQYLSLARRISSKLDECNALGNLGLAYLGLNEPLKAIEHQEQRLVIAREIGDRGGEGQSLGILGVVFANLGEPRKAVDCYEQALLIFREIGDQRGEAGALGFLGAQYVEQGKLHKAIECCQQQLAIAREIGNRSSEGYALWIAALAYEDLGERGEALPHAEQALAIYEAIENPNAAQIRATLAQWRGA